VNKLGELLPALRICALDKSEAIEDEEELMAQLNSFYARKRKRVANL
jgi:hypothetical protein